jgi:hypothetical protein
MGCPTIWPNPNNTEIEIECVLYDSSKCSPNCSRKECYSGEIGHYTIVGITRNNRLEAAMSTSVSSFDTHTPSSMGNIHTRRRLIFVVDYFLRAGKCIERIYQTHVVRVERARIKKGAPLLQSVVRHESGRRRRRRR